MATSLNILTAQKQKEKTISITRSDFFPLFKIPTIPVKVAMVTKKDIDFKIHCLAKLKSDLSSHISPRITPHIKKR